MIDNDLLTDERLDSTEVDIIDFITDSPFGDQFVVIQQHRNGRYTGPEMQAVRVMDDYCVNDGPSYVYIPVLRHPVGC